MHPQPQELGRGSQGVAKLAKAPRTRARSPRVTEDGPRFVRSQTLTATYEDDLVEPRKTMCFSHPPQDLAVVFGRIERSSPVLPVLSTWKEGCVVSWVPSYFCGVPLSQVQAGHCKGFEDIRNCLVQFHVSLKWQSLATYILATLGKLEEVRKHRNVG